MRVAGTPVGVIREGNARESTLDREFRRCDWKTEIECARNGVECAGIGDPNQRPAENVGKR